MTPGMTPLRPLTSTLRPGMHPSVGFHLVKEKEAAWGDRLYFKAYLVHMGSDHPPSTGEPPCFFDQQRSVGPQLHGVGARPQYLGNVFGYIPFVAADAYQGGQIGDPLF